MLAQGNSVCNMNIYVLDTHRYDTWNDEDDRIHFIEGDALDIDSIFTGIKFDYVLCNMFFHHLLGNSYKQSGEFRKLLMDKIKNTLKADGKVAIIDNWNDGFMWDEVSCRMIYFLTSIKNPNIIKICKKMESNAAGVGVCMLSKKMWYRLVESVGMNIIDTVESGPQKLGLLKKICLFNKSYRMYNLMILQRKEGEDGREYGRAAK